MNTEEMENILETLLEPNTDDETPEGETRNYRTLVLHDSQMQERIDQALASLRKIMAKEIAEVEKAFGGCKNCYGKGYATARIGTSSKYGNLTKDTLIYCKCSRGKQLEALSMKEEL